MRVTNSLFYQNSVNNYQRNMQELYKTNAQIASGLKIQNSFEDSGVYVDTMRLNYEVATLEQVKESSSKAQTYANNTDSILNQFTDSLNTFKTKLIQASNASNSSTSLGALANELSSLREHMISLGNTSINGKYMFSGTAFVTKPVKDDGSYVGNDQDIEALIGSGVKLPYNITGKDLFLGKDTDYNRVLSTNVKMLNQIELHSKSGQPKEVYLEESNTIKEMLGENQTNVNNPNGVFYLSGRKADGDTFSTRFSLSSSSKISDLLERIGKEFGNTSTNKVVDVQMNDHGQIELKDLKTGNGLLEMNIFGAVDRSAVNGDGNANKLNIDDLLAQSDVDIISFSKSDFKTVVSATTVTSREDIYSPGTFRIGYPLQDSDGSYVDTNTVLSSFMPSDVHHIDVNGTDVPVTDTVQDMLNEIQTQYGGIARLENGQIILENPITQPVVLIAENSLNVARAGFSTPDSMNYERRGFEKDGNQLSGNVSQVVKDTNEYATGKTKLFDVTGASLDGKTLNIVGTPNNATINLATAGSTFSVGGNTYDILNSSGTITRANDMTYQQLNDVIAMVTSNKIPTNNVPAHNPPDVINPPHAGINFMEYNYAVANANNVVEVGLDYKGKLQIQDKSNSETKIEFSMFDLNASNADTASTLSFMANDAVKIEDPNIDFYKDLDNMIEAVRSGTFRMDGDSNNPRNTGIQNSISRIDHIMDHVTKEHTKIGAYSNALSNANERVGLLSINVQTIRSEVIDVDIGEAYMKFNQLSNSYQAMLSTAAKINSMSLLNYM